jgi:hypothetical protein
MTIFTEAFHQFKHWAEVRRTELTPIIGERANYTVLYGPYKDMIIWPKWLWSDGDYVNKLLGLYENELYPAIESELAKSPDLIINVGSAEGFHGLGCALRTNVCTILIDTDANVLEIAKENSLINNLDNVEFDTTSSAEHINSLLEGSKNPFIIMDCEGAERELINLDIAPNLKKAAMIIETHDCFIADLTDYLTDILRSTHDVTIICQGAKNPYLEPINDLCDIDKMIICSENRPITSCWIYAVPKKETI